MRKDFGGRNKAAITNLSIIIVDEMSEDCEEKPQPQFPKAQRDVCKCLFCLTNCPKTQRYSIYNDVKQGDEAKHHAEKLESENVWQKRIIRSI